MRKHLVLETVRSIASPPSEEEGNVMKDKAEPAEKGLRQKKGIQVMPHTHNADHSE